MTTVYLKCTGANLRAQVHGEITAGMRGIAVEISFDEAWQGLTPVLVVDCAETVKKMAVDAAGHSSIPWECCIGGELLKVGLCGLNADGTVKLPTVWVSCGKVLPSTDDVQAEESSAPPTPGLLEQIAALANQAQTAAHAVTEAAQQGEFNGQDGTTPNIQIGNVTTVSSGTPAAVRRRGTDENPVLDFDIPKGEDAQGNGLVVDPEAVPAPLPETLPLDKTLSQPDQAAEALATGIAVGSLASRVSTLESKPQIPPSVELRLNKLEAAAEGNLYMFWEDDAEGYSKTVPDDAMLYATLDKIGGKTVVQDGTLVSADVESVEIANVDGTVTSTKQITEAIRSLPGYGWSTGSVYNEVDIDNKRYIQRVGSVDLGTLTWGLTATQGDVGIRRYQTSGLVNTIAKPAASAVRANCLCAKYDTVSAEKTWYGNIGVSVDGGGRVQIFTGTELSIADWMKSISGLMLYYELAEPIITDISDLIPNGFEDFKVEAGGTITFKQSGSLELPVPNQETYMIKLGGGNT